MTAHHFAFISNDCQWHFAVQKLLYSLYMYSKLRGVMHYCLRLPEKYQATNKDIKLRLSRCTLK